MTELCLCSQSWQRADGGFPGGWAGQPASPGSDPGRAAPPQPQPGAPGPQDPGLSPRPGAGGSSRDHPQRQSLSGRVWANIWPHPLPAGEQQLEDQVRQPEDQRAGLSGGRRDGSARLDLQLYWIATSLQLMRHFICWCLACQDVGLGSHCFI